MLDLLQSPLTAGGLKTERFSQQNFFRLAEADSFALAGVELPSFALLAGKREHEYAVGISGLLSLRAASS